MEGVTQLKHAQSICFLYLTLEQTSPINAMFRDIKGQWLFLSFLFHQKGENSFFRGRTQLWHQWYVPKMQWHMMVNIHVWREIYMLYVKPNNRSYEKWYKNMKVFVFVFEILLKVFVFKYICIWEYLYLIVWKVFVFVFKYFSMYLTTCLLLWLWLVKDSTKEGSLVEVPTYRKANDFAMAVRC